MTKLMESKDREQLDTAIKQLHSAETEEACQEAVKIIRRLAEKEYAEAQVQLALLYDDGDTVLQNKQKAFKWFLRAAQQGHPRGQNAIGNFLCEGINMKKDERSALEWYKKAAAQRYIKTFLNFAMFYYNGGCGITVDQDVAKKFLDEAKSVVKTADDEHAIYYHMSNNFVGKFTDEENLYWCTRAAKGENSDAQVDLAWYCYHGQQEDKLFLAWYKKAAKNGNIIAMNYLAAFFMEEKKIEEAIYWAKRAVWRGSGECAWKLGLCYDPIEYVDLNKVIIKDINVAAKWYHVAAERKYHPAYYKLAMLFYLGESGVEKNYKKAVQFFRKFIAGTSTQKKHLLAEYHLALCYFYGRGVDKNHDLALQWMTIAANGGCMKAQHTLGSWYAEGTNRSLPQDHKMAVLLWKKATEQGCVNSLIDVARSYWEGKGTEKNKEKSLELMTEAAEKGAVAAMANLGLMYSLSVYPLKNDDCYFRNTKEATKWLRAAVANNFVDSYYKLSLELDYVVEYDPRLSKEDRFNLEKESVEWMNKAIQSNDKDLIFYRDICEISKLISLRPVPLLKSATELPAHKNIVPFNCVTVYQPFTLKNFLLYWRTFTLDEVIHVGKQLCDALMHLQKNNCAQLCCSAENIYILLPRVYEMREMYLEQLRTISSLENFPSDLLWMIGTYLTDRILNIKDVTTDIFLRSRLVINGFQSCVSLEGDSQLVPDQLAPEKIAPEITSEVKTCQFANAYTLGQILETMLIRGNEQVWNATEFGELIEQLLQHDTGKRKSLQDAHKSLFSYSN